MIYSTATVPVNPAGETKLTREQAWKDLELKARDARLFLPPGLRPSHVRVRWRPRPQAVGRPA